MNLRYFAFVTDIGLNPSIPYENVLADSASYADYITHAAMPGTFASKLLTGG